MMQAGKGEIGCFLELGKKVPFADTLVGVPRKVPNAGSVVAIRTHVVSTRQRAGWPDQIEARRGGSSGTCVHPAPPILDIGQLFGPLERLAV